MSRIGFSKSSQVPFTSAPGSEGDRLGVTVRDANGGFAQPLAKRTQELVARAHEKVLGADPRRARAAPLLHGEVYGAFARVAKQDLPDLLERDGRPRLGEVDMDGTASRFLGPAHALHRAQDHLRLRVFPKIHAPAHFEHRPRE